ncbi:MAG: molybdopterin-dependent oxidoreductase [Acidimicrobiia bacterium]|jgi:DMSO/TMAO reductase YedYZ molybdopterin-dependent catalytic subunit
MFRRLGAAGMLAALAGLAAGELLAGLLGTAVSPVEAIGNLVIDLVPPAVKDLAISLFGTRDKPVLILGIVAITAGLGWWAGTRAERGPAGAGGVFAGAAGLAMLALGRDPRVGWVLAAVVAGASLLVGLGVLVALQRSAREPGEADEGRRGFVLGAGAVLGLVLVAAVGGRALLERGKRSLAGRDGILLPPAAMPSAPPPEGASLDVPEITPIVTSNDDFFRIDTALSVPAVDLEDWSLRVTGMVDREVELTFAELLDFALEEHHVTLSCVSNEVGGDLVGTALWLGVPLRRVLDLAGPAAGAEQIVGRSVDGFTVGFPVQAAYDGRNALVAVGMNGEPLPFEHGFPARLVVAGLYGYVSATKWLAELELTTWDGFDAFWVPKGWSKEAPVKTQSRIDTPRSGSALDTSPRAVAGVAWAPGRGIAAVEVRVDDGPWRPAELSVSLSDDAWVQWRVPWRPEPGNHVIRVRATDGTGQTQDEEVRRPAPDGATGYHTVRVRVA